jgi:hypothetical protein
MTLWLVLYDELSGSVINHQGQIVIKIVNEITRVIAGCIQVDKLPGMADSQMHWRSLLSAHHISQANKA